MEGVRDQFIRELENLSSLIKFFNSESKLLTELNENDSYTLLLQELSDQLKSLHIAKKQYDYNSIVISLYGAFEKFIENLLVSYVDKVNALIQNYNSLPDPIKKNHFNLSISLLNKVGQPRYTGFLKKEEIIKNLHTCLNNIDGYQLNKDAFSQHSANFRLQVINDAFSHIGVNGIDQLIMANREFYEYVIAVKEKNIGDFISPEECFTILNDLADRRNDVAHGVPCELLSNEILDSYLNYFKKYSYAICSILLSEIWHHEYEFNAKPLGEITDVLKEGEVVCIFSNNTELKKGAYVIGKNESTIEKAQIISIQINNAETEFIKTDQNIEIGLMLDKKFKKNFKISVCN